VLAKFLCVSRGDNDDTVDTAKQCYLEVRKAKGSDDDLALVEY